ncbi:MAG: hypothetical protein V4696_08200 [Pseudomonadota bacterium]
MRCLLPLSALSTALMLSACGGSAEDNQVTETRMDDLDSLEGTISDDMINTDESTDEAPVDAAPAEGAKDKAAEPKTKLDPAQAKESGGPDIVKIEPDDSAN